MLIIGDVVKFAWGPDNRSISRPAILAGSVLVGGRDFPTYNLVVIALGPLVAAALWLLLTRTQFGRLIRAAASDREMVGVVGADVSRLFTGVFVLGAWLGGLGGGLAAPVGAIYPGMDVEVIAESFIVVVVGGMGSLTGTLLGSLIIGQLNAFGVACQVKSFWRLAEAWIACTKAVESPDQPLVDWFAAVLAVGLGVAVVSVCAGARCRGWGGSGSGMS